MRVDWVHPSWRDLVIEQLAQDDAERRRFLAHCGVDGAALALSWAGGAGGERERPLLRSDADWDALGDGLYSLCPDLDEAEAIRLLGVLEAAGEDREVLALAELVLKRLGWSGRAISVDAFAAWAPLARKLDPPPQPPAMTKTWAALEPAAEPTEPQELERFADWLRLAELLREHDPETLARLGFPERYEDILDAFARRSPDTEPVLERELRLETLDRLAVLDPELAAPAMSKMAELTPPVIPSEPPEPPPAPGEFPVARVLRDLG